MNGKLRTVNNYLSDYHAKSCKTNLERTGRRPGRWEFEGKAQVKELELFRKINGLIGNGEGLEVIFETISAEIKSLYGYDHFFFFQLSQSNDWLGHQLGNITKKFREDLERSFGLRIEGNEVLLPKGSKLTELIEEKEVVFSKGSEGVLSLLEDLFGNKLPKESSPGLAKMADLSHIMAAPVRYEERVVGVVVIINRDKLTKKDKTRVNGLLTQMGIAIREEELRQKVILMQQELIDREKLAGLGMLIHGITHNMSSPLTRILNRSEYMQRWVKKKRRDLIHRSGEEICDRLSRKKEEYDKIIREMGLIVEDIGSLSEIVRNMTYKSRHEQTKLPQWIDLNKLIKEELSFLAGDMFYKHEVEKIRQFDESLPHIKAVYSDLSMSFINIIKNALEAMHESEIKKLTITTSHDRQGVYYMVHDTGCGINQKDQAKIFKPFFTTKMTGPGKGSQLVRGLGLSAAFTMLGRYGAVFDVASKPGRTVFTVRFNYNKERMIKNPLPDGKEIMEEMEVLEQ